MTMGRRARGVAGGGLQIHRRRRSVAASTRPTRIGGARAIPAGARRSATTGARRAMARRRARGGGCARCWVRCGRHGLAARSWRASMPR